LQQALLCDCIASACLQATAQCARGGEHMTCAYAIAPRWRIRKNDMLALRRAVNHGTRLRQLAVFEYSA
jgi:hypothetical protein